MAPRSCALKARAAAVNVRINITSVESRVKKVVLLLLVVLGCRSGAARRSGPLPGGETPRAAVDGFLRAVRAQDLQAMATIWGNEKGPVRDNPRMSHDDLERAELVMQCHLSHDSYRIVSEGPGERERKLLRVALTLKTLTRETDFTTVQSPSDKRWYVEDVNLNLTRDLCVQSKNGR
jgi:hypothetical protein